MLRRQVSCISSPRTCRHLTLDWTSSLECLVEVQDLETWLMQRLGWLDAEFSLVASGKYVYPTSDLILVPAGENFPTIATASLAG